MLSEDMRKTLADLFLLKPSLTHSWPLCEGRNVRLLSKAAPRRVQSIYSSNVSPGGPVLYLVERER